MRRSEACRVIFLGVLVFAGSLFSQTAQITGRVTDPTGAVVPGVDVKVVNTETRSTRTTTTNEEGYYAVPLLPPGEYQMTLKHAGLKTVSRSGMTLVVDQNARLDYPMEVGAVGETVTIVGQAPLVNTESATQGAVVETRRVTDLPLNGRNPLALELTVAGVRSMAGPTQTGFGDRGIALSEISINGAPQAMNAVLLDGNNNLSGWQPEVNVSPAVDAVEEFKVLTNSMSAEYGFTAGGVVNMVTKGGTNTVHGTLYEFVRNEVFDGRNAFSQSRDP
ncbi:MAG: carboxypeptidase regulatory-like domain-containing protein, partial [Candidatus Solibacter sp.]